MAEPIPRPAQSDLSVSLEGFQKPDLGLPDLGLLDLGLLDLRDGVRDGIVLLDVIDAGWADGPEFRFAALNPAIARTSPIPVEQLLGKTLAEAFPHERATRYRQHYRDCVNSGQSLTFEEHCCHEGQETWWLLTVNPLCSQPGPVDQVLVTAIDMTTRAQQERDRQATEAALAASEAKFRRLIEEADDALGVWGLDGILTYLSPGIQKIFGIDPAHWLGQSFVPLVHPDDLPMCLAVNQQVMETGQPQTNVKFRNCHRDGHWVWVSMNVAPIKDQTGMVIAFQGILRDISESKRQEDALRWIVEGTAANTGTDFFRACVQHLAALFQVKYAFIAELVDPTYCQSRMLSLWTDGDWGEPYEFDLPGTPCSVVFQETWVLFPDALQQRFPTADALATLNAESYLGGVIVDSQGRVMGNLGIMDTKPLVDNLDDAKSILQLFAVRVGAEMERKIAEVALQEYANRQFLLNQLANQIRNSLDFDAIIATTLDAVRTLLHIDYCGFAWYEPAAELLTWRMIQESLAANIPSRLGAYPAALMGPIESLMLHQEILQIDDVDHYDEPIHRAFLQAMHCKSEILLPIQTHAQDVGVLVCVHYAQVRPWTDSEIELLQAVRDQLAIAIDQAALYAESRAKSRELKQMLQELRRTQAQMLQAEKMSSLGQLVAGVAHEINNPISFIYGNVSHATHYAQELFELIDLYQQEYLNPTAAIAQKIRDIDLEFLRLDLPKALTSMETGTQRIREIVKSLRLFSRLDEAEVKSVDIHDGIDSTLMILRHRLEANPDRAGIEIIKRYGKLPQIECFAGQLNQVFMNILVNAIDALEERDTGRLLTEQQQYPSIIYVTTTMNAKRQVEIRIRDNGPGIPDPIQARLFDPFFTTKSVGKGAGMGLSISYQIITQKHGGQLSYHSVMGQGVEFLIQIPMVSAADRPTGAIAPFGISNVLK